SDERRNDGERIHHRHDGGEGEEDDAIERHGAAECTGCHPERERRAWWRGWRAARPSRPLAHARGDTTSIARSPSTSLFHNSPRVVRPVIRDSASQYARTCSRSRSFGWPDL